MFIYLSSFFTQDIMITYILFVLGLVLLVKGADYLVDGASSFAKKFGVSPLIIGLTIVAFGTSLPELIVNVLSALQGSGDIAFGNIVGSSIANILLILGVAALIFPLQIKRSATWKEIPFSLLAVFLLLVFFSLSLLDNLQVHEILRTEGIILLSFFVFFLFYLFESAKKERGGAQNFGYVKDSSRKIFFLIVVGLVALYLGGRWTVDGAVSLARMFGFSEFFISATIVAIGTSLPELFTTIVAAMKRESDLIIGNVIGSNIFNILWVLGITAVIQPLAFPPLLGVHLILLFLATLLLFFLLFVGRKHTLGRWEGVLFVLLYFAYLVFLVVGR
jgi:cation:H+ antiporter